MRTLIWEFIIVLKNLDLSTEIRFWTEGFGCFDQNPLKSKITAPDQRCANFGGWEAKPHPDNLKTTQFVTTRSDRLTQRGILYHTFLNRKPSCTCDCAILMDDATDWLRIIRTKGQKRLLFKIGTILQIEILQKIEQSLVAKNWKYEHARC